MLEQFYAEELERFRRDRETAKRFLDIGEHPRDERLDIAELAACTMVATTIMNFDEFSMKR